MSWRSSSPSALCRSTVAVLALCWICACSAGTTTPTPARTLSSSTGSTQPPVGPVRVAGSVVSTAGSSNETQIVVPAPIAASWTELGRAGSGVEWVSVAGDGRVSTQPIDLTGDHDAAVAGLTDKMNAAQAKTPGRSALAGLAAITSPAGAPVWVFSPLLDTEGGLDFNQLAFDQSPPTVVAAIRKAGGLPNLKGRDVTFVVTPTAGQQKKLSNLQVGYVHAIWEGLATAGGAAKITFFDGTGRTPGTGTIPPIAIPNPHDKVSSAGQGRTRTCTLPSPALFVPDQPTLIDKAATLTALGQCLGTLDATTKITVEGHTAAVAGGDAQSARDLSTRRATEVAALLRELKVPARNITAVVGYGDSKPLVAPASSPANRAVVVTFTSAG